MPRKRKTLSFVEAMNKLHAAGLDRTSPPNHTPATDIDNIPDLNQRLKTIFNVITNRQRPAHNMLFFVMYDIESNRVRRQIVKYLERQGCSRVQKSIFLADLPTPTFEQIKNDLAEVQACYDNQDSILVVPISTDYLQAMKVIGQEINIDVITKSKNTLFF